MSISLCTRDVYIVDTYVNTSATREYISVTDNLKV